MQEPTETKKRDSIVPELFSKTLDKRIDVLTFASEVHKTAASKGWWDDEKPVDDAYALMHSELSEALEAYRKDMKDDKVPDFHGIDAEIGDTIIRILDWAAYHNLLDTMEEAFKISEREASTNANSYGVFDWTLPQYINEMHKALVKADEFHGNPRAEAICLSGIVSISLQYCKVRRPQMVDAMLVKAEFNKSRGYKHGNKKI